MANSVTASVLPWVPIVVILLIPLVIMSASGRTWLVKGQQRYLLWLILIVAASVGILGWLGIFGRPVKAGNAVLVVMPLAQALIYSAAYKLFAKLARREPMDFDDARYARPSSSGVWADKAFWICMLLGLILGATLLCGFLGVEFPHRG
jgi:hypothetical protein